MRRSQAFRSRFAIGLAAAAIVLLISVDSASAVPLAPTPSPGWQANGRVTTIIRVNGVVYIGGQFTQVVSSGGGQIVARSRLAAFDAATGALLPWNPRADNTVRALAFSQNGGLIYVGGAFTHVGGWPRTRVAEVQAATVGAGNGVVVPRFRVNVDAPVWGLSAFNGELYMGGEFQHVNGRVRQRLAAVNTSSGRLSQTWVPRANKVVRVLLFAPTGQRLFIGGYFTEFNGQPQQHLVAVTPSSGRLLPWRSHPGGAVKALAATATQLIEGDAGGGGHVRTYVISSGKLRWTGVANGDVERVVPYRGTVLVGGHFTTFGAYTAHHLVALNLTTGRVDPSWRPSADSIHGVFALTAYGQQVYAGGDFTRWYPGAIARAHFAQFDTGIVDTTPPKVTVPPRLVVPLGAALGTSAVPTRVSFAANDAGVSGVCRYQLQKSFAGGAFAPVSLPWMTAAYANLAVTPSTRAYRFQVRATDCADNASAFVPGAAAVLTAIADRNPVVHYSAGWTTARVAGSYGGTVRRTSRAGATATVAFTGREVVWIASHGTSMGVARVFVDGHPAGTKNLHAPLFMGRRAVFTRVFPTSGHHVLKLVAAGTPGHATVDVDGFLVVR